MYYKAAIECEAEKQTHSGARVHPCMPVATHATLLYTTLSVLMMPYAANKSKQRTMGSENNHVPTLDSVQAVNKLLLKKQSLVFTSSR